MPDEYIRETQTTTKITKTTFEVGAKSSDRRLTLERIFQMVLDNLPFSGSITRESRETTTHERVIKQSIETDVQATNEQEEARLNEAVDNTLERSAKDDDARKLVAGKSPEDRVPELPETVAKMLRDDHDRLQELRKQGWKFDFKEKPRDEGQHDESTP